MSAHTPGPWKWVEGVSELRNLPTLVGADGEVCHFGDAEEYYPTEGDPPCDEDKALIAAAPDLLVALKRFVSIDKYMECDLTADCGICLSCQARAAIAKAEGQS